jgi:hypothetical protein
MKAEQISVVPKNERSPLFEKGNEFMKSAVDRIFVKLPQDAAEIILDKADKCK